MKLLDKKVIDRQRSEERRLQIEEGVQLAKKVDALRELSSKEEMNLTKFREEALESTKREIHELIQQRNGLKGEVELLQEEKRLLQVPIDAEWVKVRARNTDLDQVSAQIDARLVSLANKEIELDNKAKELAIEEERLSDEKEQIRGKHREADTLKRKTESHSEASHLAWHQRKNELDAREQLVLEKEARIAVRERNVEMFALRQDSIRVSLDNKQRQLADREQVLIQNEQRKTRRQ